MLGEPITITPLTEWVSERMRVLNTKPGFKCHIAIWLPVRKGKGWAQIASKTNKCDAINYCAANIKISASLGTTYEAKQRAIQAIDRIETREKEEKKNQNSIIRFEIYGFRFRSHDKYRLLWHYNGLKS